MRRTHWNLRGKTGLVFCDVSNIYKTLLNICEMSLSRTGVEMERTLPMKVQIDHALVQHQDAGIKGFLERFSTFSMNSQSC